jgi:hypothetical protein
LFFLDPTKIFPHTTRIVISTEAAHVFVSSAVEKSASPPQQYPRPVS